MCFLVDKGESIFTFCVQNRRNIFFCKFDIHELYIIVLVLVILVKLKELGTRNSNVFNYPMPCYISNLILMHLSLCTFSGVERKMNLHRKPQSSCRPR